MRRESDLRTDILVMGLPSQGEPACDGLLEAMQPRLIIVADSEFPVSERAREGLRKRLTCQKAAVVYTRFSGAATIELRRGSWRLRTMNGPEMNSRDLSLANDKLQDENAEQPGRDPSFDPDAAESD